MSGAVIPFESASRQPSASPIANVVAEAGVCGALMVNRDLIDRVTDRLSVEDFFEPAHARIFSTVIREHALGHGTTPVSLAPLLADDETLRELGGASYLFQLTESPAVALTALDSARQIADMAQRRRFVEALQVVIGETEDLNTNLEALISSGDAALSCLAGKSETATEVSAGEALDRLIRQIGEEVHGVQCGAINDMDKLMGPLRPKKLVVVGGRPGMGKTACAISYAIGAARRGHGVLFVSLEMGAEELAGRIGADMCFDLKSPVPYSAINESRMEMAQIRKLRAAQELLAKLPFRIVDRSTLTSSSLDTLIRRHKRRLEAAGSKLELVVVDYLQLMRPDHRTESPYQAVSEVSRRLKESAKEHGVAVMALAQLSRAVEQREDKRPQLSDLKESGQIEQDADIVLFLYRAAYYAELGEPEKDDPNHPKWAEDYEIIRDKIEFILAKRRDGKKGKALGHFFTEYQAMRSGDFYRVEGAVRG